VPGFTVRISATNERGPLYAEQFLSALHHGNGQRLPVEFGIGSQAGATRLHLDCPEPLAALARSQFFAAYPDAQLVPEEVESSEAVGTTFHAELALYPAIYPCKRYPQFEDVLSRATADPLAALLAMIARPASAGLRLKIAIQARPATHRQVRRYERILALTLRPRARRFPGWTQLYLQLALAAHPWWRFLAWFQAQTFKPFSRRRVHVDSLPHAPRNHEREDLAVAAADKLRRHLFEVNIHLRVQATARNAAQASAAQASAAQASAALLELAAGFGPFSLPHLATFRLGPIRRGLQRRAARQRFLLSTEELATLWHPPTLTVQTPTLARVEANEREPPVNLPRPSQHPDLATLGLATYRGRAQKFGLLPEDRLRHLALLGKTGMGKTTLLQRLIQSDLKPGRGLALIDPHGDLVEGLLSAVPPHRTNDIVLFDAADAAHPLALNLLSYDRPEQKPLVVSGILAAFKKLFGDFWGPRLEYLFRNALLALIDFPDATLLSVQRFLIDGRFRQEVLAHATNPAIRDFWEIEYAKMPPKLQAEAISPIQNKVGQFTLMPQLRNILGQPQSTLNVRRIMDDGQVLLVNLSKGRLGEDAATLLGALLISQVQLAALGRADRPEAERRNFFLYVDEFQNFATDAFGTILSEARKYRLGLIVANQYLAQLSEGTLHALFGSVGSLVCFQAGAKDAELLAEQLGEEVTPQDLLRLPRFQAYVRLLIDGHPSRPFSMATIPPAVRSDARRAEIVRRTSQRRYAHAATQAVRAFPQRPRGFRPSGHER
jgi:hypothetical protein